MKPTDTFGDILISGTWLQLRDIEGGDDFTGLLLKPIVLKEKKLSSTVCPILIWNPMASETELVSSTRIVKVLGRIQFPTPDRKAHLRVDPSRIVNGDQHGN